MLTWEVYALWDYSKLLRHTQLKTYRLSFHIKTAKIICEDFWKLAKPLIICISYMFTNIFRSVMKTKQLKLFLNEVSSHWIPADNSCRGNWENFTDLFLCKCSARHLTLSDKMCTLSCWMYTLLSTSFLNSTLCRNESLAILKIYERLCMASIISCRISHP